MVKFKLLTMILQTDKSSTGKKRQKKPRAKSNIIPDISCSSLLFALLVRVMFSLHAGIAFYRVTGSPSVQLFFFFLLVLLDIGRGGA